MGRDTGDLLQGTLGLLILKALAGGERHGYGIVRWIQEVTFAAWRSCSWPRRSWRAWCPPCRPSSSIRRAVLRSE